MSRTKISVISAVAAVLLSIAGCGASSSGSVITPKHSVSAGTTGSRTQDIVSWYSSVSTDVDAFSADLGSSDFSHAGLAKMISDVHALQDGPPFPASAPSSVRQSWSNALNDYETGLTSAQNGDLSTGSVRISDGTSELATVTAYVNGLGT